MALDHVQGWVGQLNDFGPVGAKLTNNMINAGKIFEAEKNLFVEGFYIFFWSWKIGHWKIGHLYLN